MTCITFDDYCQKPGCRNKKMSDNPGCSIECIGWILNANKCKNLFCSNLTKGHVCHNCYIKNKNRKTECLTHKCKIQTYEIFCKNCSSKYYDKKNICLNSDCQNKTSLKFCDSCYIRHKSGKTPVHRCLNEGCTNDTYIHLKYCTTCHSRYKMTSSTFENHKFEITTFESVLSL